MKVKCTSGNRDLILRVLQTELNEEAVYRPLPEFSYSVGEYTLTRDGFIVKDGDGSRIFSSLAALGLCDFPYNPIQPDSCWISFPVNALPALAVINIFCMISARYTLINRAIDARRAFYIKPSFMNAMLSHPPEIISEILQFLYGRDDEYNGLNLTSEYISFTGFAKGHPEDVRVHKLLAEKIVNTAAEKHCTKAFTSRTSNPKYVFRSWLNSIGMAGNEYEDARRILLSRLPGCSSRKFPQKVKEA